MSSTLCVLNRTYYVLLSLTVAMTFFAGILDCSYVCLINRSRISIISMNGAAIVLDDASAADSIQSVKRRVFGVDSKLTMSRQRIMYTDGPYGMNPLPGNETLDGAGVPQDGSAKIDVLLADRVHLSWREAQKLGKKVL